MSDPGTGKTLAHLLIINDDYQIGRDGRTLIVCPKTLMRSAWGNELDAYFPWLSYSIADAKNRIEAFEIDTQIVVTNTDAAVTLAKNPKLLRGFDKLIIDESTSFKHASSQRSKAMRQISKQFKRRSLLTGTPNPNSVAELWHQMLILDGGQRLGPSFFRFRGSVQMAEQVGPMPNMVKWIDKPGATDAVFSLISDVSIRHAFENVMTHVPANHVSRYEFDLNKKAQKIYEQFATHMVAQINEEQVSAVHASSLRQKLLQIASGAVYDGGEDRSYALVDTQRYELAADLIDQYKHSIVFFNWFHQREEMSKLLTARGVSFAMIDGSVKDSERHRIVNDFQAGRYQTVLLHPKTGAHGLTLTRGEACIILSPFYEADLLKQAIHRIYRGAQDKATNTILVQARNTVEGLVYGRLDEKTDNMNNFLELVVASQRRRAV
jgi:SNF2 family DNA or RNA helicase